MLKIFLDEVHPSRPWDIKKEKTETVLHERGRFAMQFCNFYAFRKSHQLLSHVVLVLPHAGAKTEIFAIIPYSKICHKRILDCL